MLDFIHTRDYKEVRIRSVRAIAEYWTFLYDMFILFVSVKGKLSLSKRKHGRSAPHHSNTKCGGIILNGIVRCGRDLDASKESGIDAT